MIGYCENNYDIKHSDLWVSGNKQEEHLSFVKARISFFYSSNRSSKRFRNKWNMKRAVGVWGRIITYHAMPMWFSLPKLKKKNNNVYSVNKENFKWFVLNFYRPLASRGITWTLGPQSPNRWDYLRAINYVCKKTRYWLLKCPVYVFISGNLTDQSRSDNLESLSQKEMELEMASLRKSGVSFKSELGTIISLEKIFQEHLLKRSAFTLSHTWSVCFEPI